jgi:lactoylglutathione lyase
MEVPRMSATFRDPFPTIYTDDVDRLATFYRESFGFKVTMRWPSEPSQPTEFVSLELGACGLGLGLPRDPLHGQPLAASSQPATFELCITTDDVDAALDRLRERGVTVLYEPADQAWGERLAYIADPDGHPVMIYGPSR